MACETNALFYEARCFAGLTGFQLQLINTQLLCQILNGKTTPVNCDAQQLLDASSCFACLTPFELQIIQTELLCEILQSGGAGGKTCLDCGIVDPVAAPPCNCAMYYNSLTGSMWIWDSTLVKWYALIGG